jgi:hypothetical protein
MTGGTLYAGTFTIGTGACVWSWDGSAWSQVGVANSLPAAIISGLAIFNGTLYSGGTGVWSWNGSSWSQVGGAGGLPGKAAAVNSLAMFKGALYAGAGDGVWSWNSST